MGDCEGGFRVRIKRSAIEANEAIERCVERTGRAVTFESRDAASDFARRRSTMGDAAVAIQRASPQDDACVDAYLVARPERRTRDPEGSVETGLTFDTTGNQYGAIGEALILAHETDPPVLSYYARKDLDVASPDRITVEIDDAPAPVTASRDDDRLEWVPDCLAIVRKSPSGRVLRRYLCEIKTGNGSLERDQRAVMRAASRHTAVLAIRLDISALPESYNARITEIDPDEHGVGTDEADRVVAEMDPRENARLDDF